MNHCEDHDAYYDGPECEECLADVAELRPPVDDGPSFSVTCNTCGYSGSIGNVKLHSCQIQEQGGRCEDYPCCGHTDGDGCQTLESHTSEYWMNLMQRDPDWYEWMDQSGAWDEMQY